MDGDTGGPSPGRKKGASRMIQLNRRACVVWLDEAEYAALRSHARSICWSGPLATLARRLLLSAAGAECRRK